MKSDTKIKPEKKKRVEELSAIMKSAKGFALIDYSSLDVKSQQELKKRLKKAGANMLVAKNTLLKIAAINAGFKEISDNENALTNQTALVFSNSDPVSPIQIVGRFQTETEITDFKAGIIEGIFQDKESLIRISKLPSRDELLARVVGAVSSPLYGITGILNANMQKLVWILTEARG